MVRFPSMRWFLVYVVIELAAVVALTWAVGLGWTLLLLLAAFLAGITLAGSQAKRQLIRLRAGVGTPHGVLTDSALIALGTVLVVVPGLVTTALGLLLLLPPVRPVAARLAARRFTVVTPRPQPDYIDGEVVDVVDVEPPALPRKPA